MLSAIGRQYPLIFSNNVLWSNLKKGTVIIIARSENTFAEDFDQSDYSLTIKSNNSLYISGTAFQFAGSSDAVQIRDNIQTHVFGVSWGSSNANSVPDPKIHFTSTSTSNTSIFFNDDDVTKLLILTNWTQNGTSSRGIGNTLQNIKGGTDFIKAVTKVKYNSRLFRAKFLKEEIIKASKNPQDQNKIPDLMSALQEAINEAEKCRWPYKISAIEYTGEGIALDEIRRFSQRLVTSSTQQR